MAIGAAGAVGRDGVERKPINVGRARVIIK